MSEVDEMVKALRWLKKVRLCDDWPCAECEFHGMCTDPDSEESIAEQIELFGKVAGQLEQLQAENEQLKASRPIRCKDCIHYIKLNNFDNECGITGGCVCDTDFCSNGKRLEGQK